MRIRTVPAAQFKNGCLKLIDEVSKHGMPLIVTRRGRPIVQIVPVRGTAQVPNLLGTIVHEDDDIFSTGENWEADRE